MTLFRTPQIVLFTRDIDRAANFYRPSIGASASRRHFAPLELEHPYTSTSP